MKRMLSLVLCLILALSCVYAASAESVYPVETDVELKVWMAGNISYSSIYPSANEHPWFQAWEERTGIAVDWLQPAAGADVTQAYNLMMAGDELPDLIFNEDIVTNASYYLDNNIILPLNDYLEEYAPNLWKLMQTNDAVEKSYKTDDGRYYCFPSLNEGGCSYGLIVNQKWLDECNLEVPETIDEVTEMLVAFKEAYGVAPYSMAGTAANLLFSAYGLIGRRSWQRTQDQVVQFTAYEEGYRDALRLLNGWFKNGLLDPDFASIDDNTIAAKAAAGQIGVIGGPYTLFQKIDAALNGGENNFIAVKYPVLNEGDPYQMFLTAALTMSTGTAISADCKHPEIACQFMDYLYSEEGKLFTNFGYLHGEDASSEAAWYYDENGNPRYTDLYMNGPEGMVEYARRYSPAIVAGCPGYKLNNAARDRNSQVMRDAEDVWLNGSDERWWYLPVLSPSVEESNRYTNLYSPISTYCGEMYYKFVNGEADIETGWDAYIKTLRDMGIDELVADKQAQLDRFNAR